MVNETFVKMMEELGYDIDLNYVKREDFFDSERLAKREAELSEYKTPAGLRQSQE